MSRLYNWSFPVLLGYEGVPTFFDDLLTHLTSILQGPSGSSNPLRAYGTCQSSPAPCSAPPGIQEYEGSCWKDNDRTPKGSHQTPNCCNAGLGSGYHQHCRNTLAAEASSQ